MRFSVALLAAVAASILATGGPYGRARSRRGHEHRSGPRRGGLRCPHDPAEERRLERRTRAATAADAEAAAAAVTGDEGQVGQWGPVVDWPVVAVHAALLENGKVLAYDSVGDNAAETYPVHDHTRATVWDPATGTQTPV